MSHLSFFQIESYRGLENVTLEEPGVINILVGENNTGKTSILEAIELLEYPMSLGHYISVAARRRSSFSMKPYEVFLNLFNQKSVSKKISFQAEVEGKKVCVSLGRFEEKVFVDFAKSSKDRFDQNREASSFQGKYEVSLDQKSYSKEVVFDETQTQFYITDELNLIKINPVFPTIASFIDPDEDLANAIKTGLRPRIIKALKFLDDNIINIEVLPSSDGNNIYIEEHGLGFMPLTNYGDGIAKVLTLVLVAVLTENGILLVDEIETGIHSRALQEVFAWFIRVCKDLQVQVFATTHSLEAIDAIIAGSKDQLSDLVVYRLEKFKGQNYVRRFSGEELWDIRHDLGQDVR